eukprot:1646837-Amphidinium_carterae.1
MRRHWYCKVWRRTSTSQARQSYAENAEKLDKSAIDGSISDAELAFQGVIQARYLPFNSMTYLCNTVLKACCRAESTARAKAWYERMKRSQVRINDKTYGKLIHVFAQHGEVEEAAFWVRELQRNAEGDVAKFSAMIHACAKAAAARDAIIWMEVMRKGGEKPNEISYTSVIDACAKAHLVEEAIKWHAEMVKQFPRSNDDVGHSCIVGALVRSGCSDKAVAWLEQTMPLMGHKPSLAVYTSWLTAVMESGAPLDAA